MNRLSKAEEKEREREIEYPIFFPRNIGLGTAYIITNAIH